METLTPNGSLPADAAPTPRGGARGLHRFANPGRFLRLSGRVLPWLAGAAVLLLGVGLPWALFFSPPDWQQGETVRIMYVHVPTAWLSQFVYATMAISARAWSGTAIPISAS